MNERTRDDHCCAGWGGHAGMAQPCGSPGLPVGRSGRCIRCERLQRGDELAHADPFVSINDVPLPGETLNRAMMREVLRPAGPVEAESWHPQWPACLLCGRAEFKHGGNGICKSCSGGVTTRWQQGKGVAIFWLPFAAGDPARYDQTAAKRWVVVRDLAQAWAYLERRAAAGGIPAGGKAVIRPTSRAGALPETVIRRAA